MTVFEDQNSLLKEKWGVNGCCQPPCIHTVYTCIHNIYTRHHPPRQCTISIAIILFTPVIAVQPKCSRVRVHVYLYTAVVYAGIIFETRAGRY